MKYWAYVNNEILGPYEKDKLLQLQAFSPSLLICPQTPVGEKTEDWKEASAYPEISAAMGQGITQAAPLPAAEQQASAFASGSAHELKPLTAASVDPVPPKESNLSGISLEVNHLERSGRLSASQSAAQPAVDPAAQTGSNFDPISLSSIGRKADNISAGLAQPAGIAKEPPGAFSPSVAQSGGIDIGLPPRDQSGANISFSPVQAQEPATAPMPVFAPEPAPAFHAAASSSPAAGPLPGLEELSRKLDLLAQNSVNRQDLLALGDLRIKLDQMGEVLSSIKNSQFQRDIMDKLSYLENAVGELKSAARDKGAAPAPAAMQPASGFVNPFSSQPAPQEQKKAEPDSRKTVIVDQAPGASGAGGKIKGFFKKLFKLLLTLALLAGVAYVAAFGLKTAGVFDVTPYLPVALPGLTGGPAAPAESPAAPEGEGAPAQTKPESKPEPKPEVAKPVDVSPEVIYFVRNYAAAPGGLRLEDKITELAAVAGGTYNPANWQVKSTGQDTFEAATAVPLKKGALTFTFAVDHAKKTLVPSDADGKRAFDALSKPAAPAKKGRRGRRGAQAATAPAADGETATAVVPPAPRAKAKTKAPAKKKAAPAEEYEYEYEEE